MSAIFNDIADRLYSTSTAAYNVATEAVTAVQRGVQEAIGTVQEAKIDAVAYKATSQIFGGVRAAVDTVSTAAMSAAKGTIKEAGEKVEGVEQKVEELVQ